MSGHANDISCNNCGSRSHLWAECDLEIDRDLRRENARSAHNSSGKNHLKIDKWKKRLAFKGAGRKMNVAFLMDLIEANLDQLELSWEEFNSMCPLELDENGYCPKEQLVSEFCDYVYDQQDDLLCLISAARGRAEVWSEEKDDTPAWDKEMFEGKLEDLHTQRNEFFNEVLSSATRIDRAGYNARLILQKCPMFEKLTAEVNNGLESNKPLQLKVFQLQGPVKELTMWYNTMLTHNAVITSQKILSPFTEKLLQKDFLLRFLAIENKFLKLEKELLEDLVDTKHLCPICDERPTNLRLVTEEGTCTHCICDTCARKLPWTNVSDDVWHPMEYQCCPYCRERVIMDACVRLTLA